MFTHDSWEEAITDCTFDSGSQGGQPARDTEVGRAPRPVGQPAAIDSLDVDLQIGWGDRWPNGDTEDGLALQGVRPEQRSPSRSWQREGKLDRDHKPDGGRRPAIQRARPDDVGLLTSDEVAFLDDGPKDPLELFADSGYITDVVNAVKSGKEATVYCLSRAVQRDS